MDRLTIGEVDALVASPRHSQEENNMAAIAVQLAEVMRENERLYKALALAGAPLEALIRSTAYQNHCQEVQIAIVEGCQSVRDALSDKKSL